MRGTNDESKMGHFMKKKIITTFVIWTNLYIVPQFKSPESEPNHLYNPQELHILKCLNVQDIHKLKKSYISTSNSKMKITFLEFECQFFILNKVSI